MTLSPRGREQLVAVPSIGRATEVTPRRAAPEADATRDLYERYARQIHSYCLHQLGNREEAEDATQSTFLNAFRGLKRGVDPEFESAWLYKIAQNVCLTRQRSSSRRRRVETPGDLEAMQDYVPAHQADSDELIRLPEALDAMPEQQRRALLLREWQGLSYKEIADELSLSQAAVETLLFRARRSLAAGLNEEPGKKVAGIAKRMGASGDLGSILSIVKSLVLTGGVKVATAVATVAATSVVAATPVTRHAVEQMVAPAHDRQAARHHVSTAKGSASTARAAHLSAPISLVPTRAVGTAAAVRTTPHRAAVSKKRRLGLPAHRSTRRISAPATPTPAVETPASTAAPETPAPAQVDPPATPPVATQPAQPTPTATDKPKVDGGNNTPPSPSPTKDDSHPAPGTSSAKAERKTSSSSTTPATAQPDSSVTPAQAHGKGRDNKSGRDKMSAKNVLAPADSSVVTTTTPTTTAPTATTPTTTTATPTTRVPDQVTTIDTTTSASPSPPAPTVTVASPQQPQADRADKGNRPAEGHRSDGNSKKK
jgi:RNA polymerase sigma factor (sigma-70 family)